jgi:hypothetical protein
MPGKKDGDPYLLRLKGMPRPVRIVLARPRTFIALAIGLASLLFLPPSWRLATRLLVAWDIFIAIYMVLAYVTVFSCGTEDNFHAGQRTFAVKPPARTTGASLSSS